MTARENALRIIRFDRPERVVAGPPVCMLAYLGCNHEGWQGGGHDSPVVSVWRDIWGTEWHREMEGVMGFPRRHPLQDRRALDTYAWPDPDDPRIVGPIQRAIRGTRTGDAFLGGSHRDTLWEKSYMVAGMENMMCAFRDDPAFAREVLHRVMDFQLGISRHYLAAGVEIVFLSDDLGTQHGPLLGARTVERFLLPEYERLFSLYRERGVLVSFHSCGNVSSVAPMLMDLSVDILNPVQASANDLGALRATTAGLMALQGAVSTRTLMEGPPERIREEVRERIATLGRDGGYFCAPDQGMPFPEEHLRAFDEALERYGGYPV